MVVLQLRFLLVPFFTSITGAAQHMMQDAALMNYIDRRILSVEVCASCILLSFCLTAKRFESVRMSFCVCEHRTVSVINSVRKKIFQLFQISKIVANPLSITIPSYCIVY